MIVCQCNILSDREIEAAVERLLRDDPWQLIVPSKVYHAMGIRGRCCGCFGDVIAIIGRMTAELGPERDGEKSGDRRDSWRN
ncbi:BFD-like [2Fe-2S] binding protein [Hoeflea marina]|uniref:BFD-like [2Fe-2S] binding protein n=1 Tax=Hoeflea marina TaxID=274592 RepID=A0A317PGL9_9HYPH|nr:(2Fe-2S)-binding protein [Hoeflea marina]PWV97811.1 BFD-like [2Fe-2S] binding protein [Hoeflea marina]